MKNQVITSIEIKETNLRVCGAVVSNDNDANMMFGWSLFRVKKKYKKLCNRGDVDLVNLEKEKVLLQLSVSIEDII